MKPKRYIVWSKKEIDLNDPWQRKWYINQVLTHGRAEDIAALDWEELRSILKNLSLPSAVRRLWEDYFGA
jgi:lysyl-tRNA synthetase class II